MACTELSAVVKGAGTRDFFGTAYGQSDDTYEGFKFGDSNVQLDDTLLLIDPEAAKAYEAAHPATSPVPIPSEPTPPGSTPLSPTPPGFGVSPSTQKNNAFYGSVDVPPATAKVRLVQIAEEVIALLAKDPNATVKVTVEISSDFPAGASDQVKRAVSENATSLGFKTKDWE